ncbi:MAG: gamma carbonic anhydrase family protein [Vulcanimicrobiaceae bacterium]|jgi:carbonic anhydrase/acetyltransferase-like protein (isoleucine patch superfamily)
MPIFSLDCVAPVLPADEAYWVAPDAVLIGDVRLERDAAVWFGAVLRADDEPITLGAGSNVQDNCVFHVDPGFPISIGARCTIGHQSILHGCTVGENSLVGMGSTILNGVRIGRNCLIGANALLTENKVIPDNSLVKGAPGKVVGEIDEAGVVALAKVAGLYVARWRRYRSGLRRVD